MDSLDSEEEEDAAAMLSSVVITLALAPALAVVVTAVVDVEVTHDENIATNLARTRCTKRSSKRVTLCSKGLGGTNDTPPPPRLVVA